MVGSLKPLSGGLLMPTNYIFLSDLSNWHRLLLSSNGNHVREYLFSFQVEQFRLKFNLIQTLSRRFHPNDGSHQSSVVANAIKSTFVGVLSHFYRLFADSNYVHLHFGCKNYQKIAMDVDRVEQLCFVFVVIRCMISILTRLWCLNTYKEMPSSKGNTNGSKRRWSWVGWDLMKSLN